jgi:hypothetical protein
VQQARVGDNLVCMWNSEKPQHARGNATKNRSRAAR